MGSTTIDSINEYDPIITPHIDPFWRIVENKVLLSNFKIIVQYLKKYFVSNEEVVYAKKVAPCKPAVLSSLVIFPDGKMTLCGKAYASTIYPFIGSIEDESIVFDNGMIQNHIKNVFSDEECKDCNKALICGGKCLYNRNNKCQLTNKNWESYIKNSMLDFS